MRPDDRSFEEKVLLKPLRDRIYSKRSPPSTNSRTRSVADGQSSHNTTTLPLTDVITVLFHEHFLQLADIRVLQLFHDADFPSNLLVLDVAVTVCAVMLVLDHLHSIPNSRLAMDNLHDGSKGSFSKLGMHIIESIKSCYRRSSGRMSINEPWKCLSTYLMSERCVPCTYDNPRAGCGVELLGYQMRPRCLREGDESALCRSWRR